MSQTLTPFPVRQSFLLTDAEAMLSLAASEFRLAPGARPGWSEP
jgi:hypothetical protein